MSEQKLTDWFPADVKPVNVGWYEREYAAQYIQEMFDWWDGKQFWLFGGSKRKHPNFAKMEPASSNRRWRGLTEPADAAQ